jgi:hypothetical protein
MEQTGPKYGNIKDELFLISLIILAGGLIYIDTYYQQFGLDFISLKLDTLPIIYKGLVVLLDHWLLLIPYFFTIIILIVEIVAIIKDYKRFLAFRIPIVYLLLFLDLVIVFPIANAAGKDQAKKDMSTASSLPQIVLLTTKDDTYKQPKDHFRLFLTDDHFVYIFSPSDMIKNAAPNLIRIPKDKIEKFITQP